MFAKPQPKTMTKEWQEASNEYAKVCETDYLTSSLANWHCLHGGAVADTYHHNSKRTSTLSTVSAPWVTRARASSRAPLLRSNRLPPPLGRNRYNDGVCSGWVVLGYRNELLPPTARPLMTPVLCPSILDTILRLCSTCLSMLAQKDLCISYCAIINHLLCSHRKIRLQVLSCYCCKCCRIIYRMKIVYAPSVASNKRVLHLKLKLL